MRVFVYGTLMKGFRNNHYLEQAKYICDAKITGYDLYKVSTYPGIVKSQDSAKIVYGELYEINDDILVKLDELEEEGDLYIRIKEKIYNQQNNAIREAYIYIYNKDISSLELIHNKWQ